jgi:coenzyme F420-dependent glucose-6-phosphate dehydrogenase
MMLKLGYAISSEEHHPRDIVRHAQQAEELGFSFALISDHFHPWIDEQGHSPFVWSILGGIAQVTKTLQIGTGVTCPTIRIHPAIIAQAAATTAAMMPGRFFLGLGTGENLNEHILGGHWPSADVRTEMLEEAIQVIRLLWQGGLKSHYGKYYTVENARLYTLPDTPPPIMIAASGSKSAEYASRIGDGLINTSPDAEIVQIFEKNGDSQRPKYGKLTVCWAESESEARATAHRYWPTSALKGTLNQELPLPSHFEAAAKLVTEDMVAKELVCGNDADKHIKAIEEFIDAGYDHIYVHQVGPDQDGFFKFYERSVMPAFARSMQKIASR